MEYSDLLILAPALLGFVILLWARLLRAPSPPIAPQETLPPNPILVDGSNVMYWGPEPSVKILAQVLRSLERAGYTPIVFFDASVGYVLDDHYYDEAALAPLLGIPQEHICV
ncbi:MAG TPA: hypothetical protein VGP75_05040, partial [Yoonia sp.]|nr:hypothetical protein [Yoonia sp.]